MRCVSNKKRKEILMYILKNALKCISRSKGRNILIGLIAFVIALSACLGLSIRQAAESAKEDTLEDMTITASISFDRQSMMSGMNTRPDEGGGAEGGGGFDRSQFSSMMEEAESLTLEDYETYAEADTVKDFYYTLTAYFDGSDDLEAVSTDTSTEADASDSETEAAPENSGRGFAGGGTAPGGRGGMTASGDFTVTGYSGENAMTAFLNGTAFVSDGQVFEEATTENVCIIPEELAIYNELEVGDVITLTNPASETETYELTIEGIYTSSETNDMSFSMFGGGQDPANSIYMSAAALQSILDDSESVSSTVTDEDTGMEYETAVTGMLSATYVFADPDDYYQFEEDVYTMGLDDSYTVSSTDISAYESSLTPLNTLSTMAGWFLVVILLIGGVILIVINVFNVRERKYEIGVLTAMGMKKGKVALQFMAEILFVTMIAVILGTAVGAVSSVPVTNTLLATQVESRQTQQAQIEGNFGRGGMQQAPPDDSGAGIGADTGADSAADAGADNETGSAADTGAQNGGGRGFFGSDFGRGAMNYITEVNSAMNLTVALQMVGIGLLLTLVASAVSVLFVMRYDPLRILANRD